MGGKFSWVVKLPIVLDEVAGTGIVLGLYKSWLLSRRRAGQCP